MNEDMPSENEIETYESLMKTLAKNETQEGLIYWMYQAVGDKVSEKLELTDTHAKGFKPYDIVDVCVNEVIDEFKVSKDYSELKEVLTNQHETLVKFLKLGYGTPEEIFHDYDEMMDE